MQIKITIKQAHGDNKNDAEEEKKVVWKGVNAVHVPPRAQNYNFPFNNLKHVAFWLSTSDQKGKRESFEKLEGH